MITPSSHEDFYQLASRTILSPFLLPMDLLLFCLPTSQGSVLGLFSPHIHFLVILLSTMALITNWILISRFVPVVFNFPKLHPPIFTTYLAFLHGYLIGLSNITCKTELLISPPQKKSHNKAKHAASPIDIPILLEANTTLSFSQVKILGVVLDSSISVTLHTH